MDYVHNTAQQELAKRAPLSFAHTAILFTLSLAVYLSAMHWRVGLEVADDGAFFLRYAQNMLEGQFWVWNSGESPVWGASAPFYPVFLAIAMFFGLTPEHSVIYTGYVLTGLSFSYFSVLLSRHYGLAAGLAFVAFTAIDSELMYFSVGGLESPLTFALLCLAAWSLIDSRTPCIIGVAAGLLMINKLDLVPVGGLVLLSLWVRDKRLPLKAILIAGAIACTWYGLSWIYFGAPVPNSFLTKSLHQDNIPKTIDWTWFSTVVYLNATHKWLALLAVPAIFLNTKKNLPILILLIGTLLTHTTAYTIKYPFEPYNWYCMPSLLCLAILAALGAGNLISLLTQKNLAKNLLTLIFLSAFIYWSIPPNLAMNNALDLFTSLYEHDRAEAGRWVNEHTPRNFKVMTYWGNPAFYSKREVIDASFLNRKFENSNLLAVYRPEILILQSDPRTNPMQPMFPATNNGYTIVKTFDKTFAYGMPYFFSVLARNDVIDQISDTTQPKDYMSLLFSTKLGDTYGIIKVYDHNTIYIHPGANTPTETILDTAAFREKFKQDKLTVKLSISPLLPQEAIARGAGDVRVTLKDDQSTLIDTEVNANTSSTHQIDIRNINQIKISVDNNGNADSDWLLLSIQ